MRKRTSKQVIEFVLCWKSIPEHGGSPLRIVCILRKKKYWKHFSFVCANSYQLEIDSEIGMEGFCLLSLLALGHYLAQACADPGHDATDSVNSYVQ